MNRSFALSPPGAVERPAPPSGYSTKDVAALLGLSAAQVRSYVRAGFLSPRQGPRGEYYFSFQDLVLLRTAKGLLAARVPQRRIHLALQKVREQLPEGRSLSGVRISAQGHHVVVRDGRDVWNAESGQALFDFELSELAREAATLPLRTPARPVPVGLAAAEPDTAEAWFDRGSELEYDDVPEEAMTAYRRALALDASLPDAHLNLGRLLHERGETAEAERHYRQALAHRPGDATAGSGPPARRRQGLRDHPRRRARLRRRPLQPVGGLREAGREGIGLPPPQRLPAADSGLTLTAQRSPTQDSHHPGPLFPPPHTGRRGRKAKTLPQRRRQAFAVGAGFAALTRFTRSLAGGL